MNYFDIYLTVASVATIAVAGLLALILMYVLAILYDIKRLSKIAKKETEILAPLSIPLAIISVSFLAIFESLFIS